MDPKRVSAVHQVPEGLEVTFFNAEAVLTFVEHAPAEWKVTTEVRVDGVVTVTPKFGTGHLLVPDAAIWAILERFDEVIDDHMRSTRVQTLENLRLRQGKGFSE